MEQIWWASKLDVTCWVLAVPRERVRAVVEAWIFGGGEDT